MPPPSPTGWPRCAHPSPTPTSAASVARSSRGGRAPSRRGSRRSSGGSSGAATSASPSGPPASATRSEPTWPSGAACSTAPAGSARRSGAPGRRGPAARRPSCRSAPGREGYTVWYEPSAVVHHLVGTSRTTMRYFLRRCFMEGISKATVSGMVGNDAALSAERDYVRATLPAGLVRGLRQFVRGPQPRCRAGPGRDDLHRRRRDRSGLRPRHDRCSMEPSASRRAAAPADVEPSRLSVTARSARVERTRQRSTEVGPR